MVGDAEADTVPPFETPPTPDSPPLDDRDVTEKIKLSLVKFW